MDTPATVPIRRNKLPQLVIVRAPGLLPMLYTTREIAEELGVPETTMRDWLLFGAPYERDNRNRIWVNGIKFAAWVKSQQKSKPARKRWYVKSCVKSWGHGFPLWA